MPLDPSIALQAKPVELQAVDPSKQLLTFAQLQNLLSEGQLHGLQAAQLGEQIRQSRGYTQAAYGLLGDAWQPGAPGQPQPQAAPGQAPAAWPQPVPPAPEGTSYLQRNVQPTLPTGMTPNVDLSTLQRYEPTAQVDPQTGVARVQMDVEKPRPDADQAPPGRQGVPNPEQFFGKLLALKLQYPLAPNSITTDAAALYQGKLTAQKADFEGRLQLATTYKNALAGVTDQTSLDHTRQFLVDLGFPMADKLPKVYNPDQIRSMQQTVLTQEQRLAQQNKEADQAIQRTTAGAARLTAETGAAKESRESLETFPPIEGADGRFYPGPRKYPTEGTAGSSGAPLTDPTTGQPIQGKLPPEQLKANAYLQRAEAAHAGINDLETKGTSTPGWGENLRGKAASSVGLGQKGWSEARQSYNQYKQDFLTAVTRGESPRMSPQQLATFEQQYFPQVGEGPEIVAQKQQARERALQELRLEARQVSPPVPASSGPRQGSAAPGTKPGSTLSKQQPVSSVQIDAMVAALQKKGSPVTREQVIQQFRQEGYSIQ